MKKILWILLISQVFVNAEFVKGTNVVTDTNRSLQWQDNEISGSITTASWENAIDICEALTVNDEEDWRLPNIRELQSLVDKTNIAPAISSVFLGTGEDISYWSSSTYIKSKANAWTVEFGGGLANFSPKIGNVRNVRCVRDYE